MSSPERRPAHLARCGFGDQPGECRCHALSDAEIERLVALYVLTEEDGSSGPSHEEAGEGH